MKQPKRILIMGLPGAGKTYFAEQLKKYLEHYSNPKQEITVGWLNDDATHAISATAIRRSMGLK